MINVENKIRKLLNRIYESNAEEYANSLKFFFKEIKDNQITSEILNNAIAEFPFSEDELSSLGNRRNRDEFKFKSIKHQCSFCIQYIGLFNDKHDTFNLHRRKITSGQSDDERMNLVNKSFIQPIEYHLLDEMEKSNFILSLIVKYKKRTEWFTSTILKSNYDDAVKQYEKILEDDFRLFLLDNGIDYPFSTPHSNSGRADVVAGLDSVDPLVCEIKIYDTSRSYGKNRIKSGFTQIVKYSNDYLKNIGYLVIFNLDDIELKFYFVLEESSLVPKIKFNNKLYYFIVVNLNNSKSASTIGKLKEVIITEKEITG